ncbi:hypothetical protein D1BOALGB6SA_1432 [Olavius sp. associated proteobacterium Delta 1]|nr:hypothetical protein D1BOALGB6SA_1432 [Olavius sp. associated proteobacterium Delta 1]
MTFAARNPYPAPRSFFVDKKATNVKNVYCASESKHYSVFKESFIFYLDIQRVF